MTDPTATKANQSALNGAEQLTTPIVEGSSHTPRPRHILLVARALSHILAPATVSVPMILLVAFYHAKSTSSALIYAAITLCFACIGPLAYILLGVRLGKISDTDVSKRSERIGPFIFGLASLSLGWLVLILTHCPVVLTTVTFIALVSGLLMLLITFWWKISMHASTLAGAATILTVLYGTAMLPTFALVVLVSWARVVLHRHTVAQVVAGALLSTALSAFILKLRGW